MKRKKILKLSFNPPSKIYLGKSKIPKSGIGVFATNNIRRGEVIEVAPILILNFSDFYDTKWNLLFEYYFWMDDFVALSLGYGSLYNHSDFPNCRYEIKKYKKTITITAITEIRKDEELCFSYKGLNNSKVPLWFERKAKN